MQNYDANEHNGRGERALGYLVISRGEHLYISHTYPGEDFNRYHSYVYACSRSGQGWVPEEMCSSEDLSQLD